MHRVGGDQSRNGGITAGVHRRGDGGLSIGSNNGGEIESKYRRGDGMFFCWISCEQKRKGEK